MERPKEWAGKDHLTDAELEQLKRDISQVYDKTGDAIFQIVQSPDTIGILQETIHDVRIVPLDGRTHRRIAWRPEMRHRQLDADCGAGPQEARGPQQADKTGKIGR